jgi:hypothetical protein
MNVTHKFALFHSLNGAYFCVTFICITSVVSPSGTRYNCPEDSLILECLQLLSDDGKCL